MSLRLEFGPTQVALISVFAVIAALLVAVFIAVAINSRRETDLATVQRFGYAIRRRWLIFLLSLLVVVVGTSMFELPYAGRADRNATKVEVTASQFAWNMSKTRFRQGQRVVFYVTASDVNHGMGIYDPRGRLVAQVQAMPKYTNRLAIELERSGEYLVSCLEYCGAGHHVMAVRFNVTPRGRG